MGIPNIYSHNCLPMTSGKNELTLNKSVVFSVPNIFCLVQGCAHSSGRFHHTSLLRHSVQLQQPQHIHHLISEDYRVSRY